MSRMKSLPTLGLHDEINIIYQVAGEHDINNRYLATLLHYDKAVCTAEGKTIEETLHALIDSAKEYGFDLST